MTRISISDRRHPLRAMLTSIDLFAGAGGLSLGLELAGFKSLVAVEYDPSAARTYEYNFPGAQVVCQDIREVSSDEVIQSLDGIESPLDLVAGGPPCPGFSNMGRSKILSLVREGKWTGSEIRHQFIQDERNQLFMEFVRIVRDTKPRAFLLENVKGMRSSKVLDENGDPLEIVNVILDEFRSIGYSNSGFYVFDAADYGVPQHRQRIFFFGTLDGRELNLSPEVARHRVTSMQAISDLPAVSPNDGEPVTSKAARSSNRYQRLMQFGLYKDHNRPNPSTGSPPQRKGELTCNSGRAVNPRDVHIFPLLQNSEEGIVIMYGDLDPKTIDFSPFWRYMPREKKLVYTSKAKKKHPRNKEYKWYDPIKYPDKMRRIPPHRPSYTIVAHLAKDGYMFVHPNHDVHRTITPREAARLQSFPDHFDFSAGGTVPMSEQFRQIGNAVPPLLAMKIGEEIIRILTEN